MSAATVGIGASQCHDVRGESDLALRLAGELVGQTRAPAGGMNCLVHSIRPVDAQGRFTPCIKLIVDGG